MTSTSESFLLVVFRQVDLPPVAFVELFARMSSKSGVQSLSLTRSTRTSSACPTFLTGDGFRESESSGSPPGLGGGPQMTVGRKGVDRWSGECNSGVSEGSSSITMAS